MPNRGGRHRKDSNHDLVVAALKRRGIGWWDTSQTEIGIDGFAMLGRVLVPCEIKDPKSTRGLALSANEDRVHRLLSMFGIRVEILTGDDASLDVLGRATPRDFYALERNK